MKGLKGTREGGWLVLPLSIAAPQSAATWSEGEHSHESAAAGHQWVGAIQILKVLPVSPGCIMIYVEITPSSIVTQMMHLPTFHGVLWL